MDDISSLRKDRGLTVRTISLANDRRHKPYKSRLNCQQGAQEKQSTLSRASSSGQLPRALTSPDQPSASHGRQLCFSNCQRPGLFGIPLIRSGLSSPCSPRNGDASRRRGSELRASTLLVAIVLLCLHAVSADSKAKSPLVRTTETSARVFRGALTPASPANPLLRSVTRAHKRPPLDFQTMKVVENWGDTYTDAMLVSGRNFMYVINASQPWSDKELPYMKLLKWNSTASTRLRCTQMNNGEYECSNFIRIVEVLDNRRIYVCGTNAYQPTCRYYSMNHLTTSASHTDTPFESEKNCDDTCGCPYNPVSTSAHLYANTSRGSRMFSAALTDYLGEKPLLMRSGDHHLQTVDGWLNEPTFIKLIEYGDKVYLFFVETADKLETGTGSSMKYARVAQVCKDDIGGSPVLHNKWSTFLKARLQCSIPGDQVTEGLTFNNLTSVSDVTQVVGADGTRMDVIFATFTTPWAWNAVSMSAVCMFSMTDSIQSLFSNGNFLGKTQLVVKPETTMFGTIYPSAMETERKVPVDDAAVPEPRPGSCNGPYVSNDVSSFTKQHPLMYDPVLPLYGKPVFTSESDVRLTQIAMDENSGFQHRLVMYLGTEDGRILRVRPRLDNNDDKKSVLLEETRVADKEKCEEGILECAVLSLHLSRPSFETCLNSDNFRPSAYIAFTDRISRVPLTNCNSYGKSDCCNADPECGWYLDKCVLRTPKNSANLPPVNDMATIPTACEMTAPPPECNEASLDPEIVRLLCEDRQSAAPTVPENLQADRPACSNRPTQRPSKQTVAHVRSVVPSPTNEREIVEQRCTEVVRDRRRVRESGRRLSNLFNHHVLPEVEQSFADTLNVLPPDQTRELMRQLREALQMTTQLVLRNHRKEYCLGTRTINSMTHVYPLLMREVESWHNAALKKMTDRDMPDACWEGTRCTGKATVSVPLAPTLWEPMKNLMTDFGAQCDTIPGVVVQEADTNCTAIPTVESCRHHPQSNAQHCQPKECKFGYSVDVKAFFRHSNDSQKFLDGILPLNKAMNRSLGKLNPIRGRLELTVGKQQPFLIQYSPVPEKVKITFDYSAVAECSLNDASCNGGRVACNPRMEKHISDWLDSIWSSMKKKNRRCVGQKRKLTNGLAGSSSSQQMRRRRNASNQVIPQMPKTCRYMKKVQTIPRDLWATLRRRAESRGGTYLDMPERITFMSLESLRQFFTYKCSISPEDERTKFEKTLKSRKPKKESVIRILPSHSLPFVIERIRSSNRIKLHYFTQRKT